MNKTYKNYDLDLYNQILQNKKVLRTSKRNTLILPEYLDKIIYVYNGLTFKKLRITEDMIGTKFGQYIFTRKYCKHKVKNKIFTCHLKINTGMNRLGIGTKEELNEIYKIINESNIKIEGIYTHIYKSTDSTLTESQFKRFENITTSRLYL